MQPRKKTDSKIPIVAIFSLPIIWGTTFSIVQRGLLDISPIAFAAIRFSLAALMFLVCSSNARKGLRCLWRPRSEAERRFRRDMIVLGVAIGFGYALQNFGLLTTTTSKSAFLTSTTIIWTPLLAFLLGRERMPLNVLAAILVTIVGIVLMTHPFRQSGIVIGDLLTIGCAMSFAVYIIWIDRSMLDAMEIAGGEHEATAMVTSSQMVMASLLFFCGLLFESPRVHLTPFSTGALLYTSLFATLVTAYLQTRYQNHVSPTVAAIIYMLEPVVAAIIAEVFLTERMIFSELLGGGLIIFGVIIAQVKPRRPRGYSQ